MRPSIRAKFQVVEAGDIKQRVAVNPSAKVGDPDYGQWKVEKVHERVVLRAVYESGAATAENVRFAKSTPSGEISMVIDNERAWGLLVPGDRFYIDFIPAPADCRKCFGQGRKYETVDGKSVWRDCDRCGATGIDPDQVQ